MNKAQAAGKSRKVSHVLTKRERRDPPWNLDLSLFEGEERTEGGPLAAWPGFACVFGVVLVHHLIHV